MFIFFVSFVAIYVKCRDVCFLCTELNTMPSQTVEVTSAPPTNLPIDGTTTTIVIIVVAVVIILVIVVGVVILVVVLRAKKSKQHLTLNKLLKATTEDEGTEMKLKHETTTEKEASSSTDQPPYAEIQTEALPNVPSKSEDLVNLNSPLTVGYSEIELEPDDSKQQWRI